MTPRAAAAVLARSARRWRGEGSADRESRLATAASFERRLRLRPSTGSTRGGSSAQSRLATRRRVLYLVRVLPSSSPPPRLPTGADLAEKASEPRKRAGANHWCGPSARTIGADHRRGPSARTTGADHRLAHPRSVPGTWALRVPRSRSARLTLAPHPAATPAALYDFSRLRRQGRPELWPSLVRFRWLERDRGPTVLRNGEEGTG
jgi:hypothetical protein